MPRATQAIIGANVVVFLLQSVMGDRARLSGLNMVGLKRRGFSREAIQDIRRAYRLLFAEEGTLQERIEDVANDFNEDAIVVEILDFLRSVGNRSVCTPRDSKEG